jgi:hypothetical protein
MWKAVLIAAVLAIVVSAQPSHAQGKTDPRCVRFYDKLGCTCALQHGGSIKPGRKNWSYPKGSERVLNKCIERLRRR